MVFADFAYSDQRIQFTKKEETFNYRFLIETVDLDGIILPTGSGNVQCFIVTT